MLGWGRSALYLVKSEGEGPGTDWGASTADGGASLKTARGCSTAAARRFCYRLIIGLYTTDWVLGFSVRADIRLQRRFDRCSSELYTGEAVVLSLKQRSNHKYIEATWSQSRRGMHRD